MYSSFLQGLLPALLDSLALLALLDLLPSMPSLAVTLARSLALSLSGMLFCGVNQEYSASTPSTDSCNTCNRAFIELDKERGEVRG